MSTWAEKHVAWRDNWVAGRCGHRWSSRFQCFDCLIIGFFCGWPPWRRWWWWHDDRSSGEPAVCFQVQRHRFLVAGLLVDKINKKIFQQRREATKCRRGFLLPCQPHHLKEMKVWWKANRLDLKVLCTPCVAHLSFFCCSKPSGCARIARPNLNQFGAPHQAGYLRKKVHGRSIRVIIIFQVQPRVATWMDKSAESPPQQTAAFDL